MTLGGGCADGVLPHTFPAGTHLQDGFAGISVRLVRDFTMQELVAGDHLAAIMDMQGLSGTDGRLHGPVAGEAASGLARWWSRPVGAILVALAGAAGCYYYLSVRRTSS